MGLAPFGTVGTFGLPDLVVDGHQVLIPPEWLDVFARPDRFRYFLDGTGSFQQCADLAAEGQRVFETALLRVTAWLLEQTAPDMHDFFAANACDGAGDVLYEVLFNIGDDERTWVLFDPLTRMPDSAEAYQELW